MIPRSVPFTLAERHADGVTLSCPAVNTQARIFVLENNLFRVFITHGEPLMPRTWSVAPDCEDVPAEGIHKLDVSRFSCPTFTTSSRTDVDGEELIIETDTLKLCVTLNGLRCSWYLKHNGADIFLGRDRRTQAYNFTGELGPGIHHYIERELSESYYGLGERAGNTERHGRRFRMRNVDPMGYDAEFTDPLYKHYPFYIVRKPQSGAWYGVFYDNLAYAELDMGQELDNYHGLYRYYHAEDGDLDYYLWADTSLLDVTRQFSRLTGKTLMPPRWSLGYSGSTMYYTDAPDAQNQLNGFLDHCRAHDIPCDSFQLSSGYTSINGKRYTFNWNHDKFPDPKAMSAHFLAHGIHLCANIKPGMLLDHPMHDELDAKRFFIRNAAGTASEEAQFWDDCGNYVDFTNPEAYAWWSAQVREKLLEMGIGSTWNDNNEFEIWDGEAKADNFGSPAPVRLLRPALTLLMLKSSFDAQKAFAPEERPYLISRSGCAGMQRYVQTWTGDNRTDWKTIRFNTRMGIGLSLSGVYNFGHDVGGFSGRRPEPELFVRWIQNGIFWPRFTIHSWNDDNTVNEPWMYPSLTPVVRQLLQLRYKLIPYFYTLMHHAVQDYMPVIRPTFLEFPSDERCYAECDDFMVGSDLLVASVVEPDQYERRVYLPVSEHGWFDYHTLYHFTGGQTVTVPAPLNAPPLLVRAGSAIPVALNSFGFNRTQTDQRGFEVFLPAGSSRFSAHSYEDDGLSHAHTQGQSAELRLEVTTTADSVHLSLKKVGAYTLPCTTVDLRCVGLNGRSVTVEQSDINVVLLDK